MANKSYAQEYKSIRFFDMSIPELSTKIDKNEAISSDRTIQISPITYITVRKGSFNQDVNVLIYKGDWGLLTQGPNKESSPISAYYVAFLDSQNEEIAPLKVVEVFVFNNYTGTNATFTPLFRGKGTPDAVGIMLFPNQAKVEALLSPNDAGFIITINKVLDENDPSLHPIVVTGNPGTAVGQATPNAEKNGLTKSAGLNSLLPWIAALIIVTLAIILIFLFMKKGEKKI